MNTTIYIHSTRQDKLASLTRSDFWFSDGNIILITGAAAFKVHRGQLERHSEVFNGLFHLPQPQDAELLDGCAWAELYDSPSDMLYFLSALYDGLYFKLESCAQDFSVTAAVLRLSTKYFVEHLRIRCLQKLETDWPSSLTAWDLREQQATDAAGRYSPRDSCVHPILLIELALELGLDSFLPSAFYDLSRYGPSKITAGTPTHTKTLAPHSSEERPTIQMKRLSDDLLCRTLRGRELAQQYIAKYVDEQVQQRAPSAECLYQHEEDPSRPCYESFYFIALNVLRSVGGIACGRDADPLFSLQQATEMLGRTDFTNGQTRCGLRLCQPCKDEFAASCAAGRQEVWGLLPAWFGLDRSQVSTLP